MSKPTVLEHRADIRAMVQEMTALQFTDAEIDANLANALNVLSGYIVRVEKLTKSGLATNQSIIDLSADCPPETVTEIILAGTQSGIVSEFRARGTELVLTKPLGATSAEIVFRSRYKHDGVNVDWYPPQYRGAVCLLAAALLIYGRQRELAESDALKANALPTVAARLWDTGISIMSGRPLTI
jgi:hypothetical protein